MDLKKLEKITAACDNGISIEVIDQFLKSVDILIKMLEVNSEIPLIMTPEVRAQILEENKVVIIRMHTETFIPPTIVVHHDLAQAIEVGWNEAKRIGRV